MAKDSKGKASELKKRLKRDNYMTSAVRECYASVRKIINSLVLGKSEKEWVCDWLIYI